MGSYFHQKKYRDVDLVVVVECEPDRLISVANSIRESLLELREVVGVPIDITIFTSKEFRANPLRDMHTLVLLYSSDAVAAEGK